MGQRNDKEEEVGQNKSMRGPNLLLLAFNTEEDGHELKNPCSV